jgi:hypothetical protein
MLLASYAEASEAKSYWLFVAGQLVTNNQYLPSTK